jgi:alpha-L-fucosidase
LQREGRAAAAKVLKTDFTDLADTFVLDIKAPYAVKSLKKLERTFVFSREGAGSVRVIDEVEFDSPQTFETALVTFSKWQSAGPNRLIVGSGAEAVSVEIDAGGAAFDVKAEEIREDLPGKHIPIRVGIALKQPVAKARVQLTITPAGKAEDREIDPLVLKKIEQFQDWKFGLFVHWGIYSQWGCIESWPMVEADKWARPDDLPAWTQRNKDFPRFLRDYQALNKTFHPKKFDPQRWADAAKAAGMKYVVFTTKHHDGFCMFDTRQTDYRTTHRSCPFSADPRADAVKAVFDTFRKQGFGIGAYYSKSDWQHPGYWAPDWPYPDRWAGFVKFTHGVVEELMSGYGPIDILWLDGGQVRPPKQDIDMPRLAAMARKHQPGLIVVDRTVGGRYENYRTPEQEVPQKALPYVWETCMTMGDQWSFKPDDKYKSTRKLIHLLVDIVAKGGNFLLNIGPDADGQFPPTAIQRLDEIGRWMKLNGEAIYGTRAVAPYKEGRVCLTKKGDKLYLICLAEEGETVPPAEIKVGCVKKLSAARMLGSTDAVQWTSGPDGTTFRLPAAARQSPPCQHAWTLEVITKEN